MNDKDTSIETYKNKSIEDFAKDILSVQPMPNINFNKLAKEISELGIKLERNEEDNSKISGRNIDYIIFDELENIENFFGKNLEK